MKISLRKANALQNSINELIKKIVLETTVSINQFEDPSSKIAATKAKALADIARRQSLYAVLYGIRSAVGCENAACGVDAKLTKMAQLGKLVDEMSNVAASEIATDMMVIQGKLDKIKSSDKESYYQQDVSTGVFTDSEIAGYVAIVQNAKKEKQKLSDEILELNIRSEIELGDDAVAILQRENLI